MCSGRVKYLQKLIYYVTELLNLVFAVVTMHTAGEEFRKRVMCTIFDMYFFFIIIVIEKKIEWLFVFVLRKV